WGRENLSGNNSFAGPITLLSDSTITTAADSLTLTEPIGGAGGLTKQGSGTLTLSALNSYADNTIIDAGTVIVTVDGALGAADTNTTGAGGTLALSGGFTYATPEGLTLNGTGAGGAGALQNLSGNNTFTGGIGLASPSTIASASDILTLTGPVFTGSLLNGGLTVVGSGNTIIQGHIFGAAGLTVAGTGTLPPSAGNNLNGQPTPPRRTL